jgi:outer membrane protein W
MQGKKWWLWLGLSAGAFLATQGGAAASQPLPAKDGAMPAASGAAAAPVTADPALVKQIDQRIEAALKNMETGVAIPPPKNDIERLIDQRIEQARKRFEGQMPQPAVGPEDDRSIEARIQRAMTNMEVPVSARRGKWYGNAVSFGAAFPNLDLHTHSLSARFNLHGLPVLGDRSIELPSAALDIKNPSAAPIAAITWYPMGNRRISIDALAGLPLFEASFNGIDLPLSLIGEAATLRFLPIMAIVNFHFLPQRMINPYIGLGPMWSFTYHERVEARGYLGDNTKPDKTRVSLNNPWSVVYNVGADINITDRFFFKAEFRWVPRIHIHAQIRDVNLLGTGINADARLKHLKLDADILAISTGLRF